MADQRLIDANALALEPDEHNVMNGVRFVGGHRDGGRTIAMVKHALKKMIENAPTIDAVPVVRCRDCQEIEPCVAVNDGYSWCNRWGTVVSLDGFCHKGAKMDGIYDAMKKLQQELPDYIKTLDSVTPERKAALLNGDWDPPDTNKE